MTAERKFVTKNCLTGPWVKPEDINLTPRETEILNQDPDVAEAPDIVPVKAVRRLRQGTRLINGDH